MKLERLIYLIETDFDWREGWTWLLRNDEANGGYFANIIYSRNTIARLRFFSYGPTKEIALEEAYKKAMVGKGYIDAGHR